MQAKRLLFLLSFPLFVAVNCRAQQTIIVAESGLPYYEQSWLYSGTGNAFPGDDIKKKWDEQKRITTVAYTSKGWFLAMSKGTGIGMQTYKVDTQWPDSWIEENWKKDYYITAVCRSLNQWAIIMSQGEGYTGQSYKRDTWSNVKTWIKEKWDKNYYITDAHFDGTYWTVIMSKHSKYKGQGYFGVDDVNDLSSKIKKEVWDKGNSLQLVEYGAGNYLVVYRTYTNGKTPLQRFSVNNSDVSGYIKTCWNESKNILHIGGGTGGTKNKPSYTIVQQSKPGSQPSKPGSQPSKPSSQPSKPGSQPSKPSSQPSKPSGRPGGSNPQPSMSKDMFLWGFLGTYNITSCVDMVQYGLDMSYSDYGGGMVFNYKSSKSEGSTNEFIMTMAFSSANTIPDGDMVKFLFPMDFRWFRGWNAFQFYFGLGLQYNCLLYSYKTTSFDYMYGYETETEDIGFDAHQLSANFQAGFLLFGSKSKVHILLGGKWHQPIVGGSLGSHLGGGTIDFSQDKRAFVMAATLSFTIGHSVLMLEYNLPLGGGGKQQQPSDGLPTIQQKPSFFEGQSQSFALTLLFGS